MVTIIGTNFQSGARVSFDRFAATDTKFVSRTQLECTTPAQPAGLVDVTVINPDGQSAQARDAFTFVLHVVRLAWNPSTSPVNGYNVYRATASDGPYIKLNRTPINGTTYADETVQGGRTFFYVANAVGRNGAESAYSNKISVEVPKP